MRISSADYRRILQGNPGLRQTLAPAAAMQVARLEEHGVSSRKPAKSRAGKLALRATPRSKRLTKIQLAAMTPKERILALAMQSGWLAPAAASHPQYHQCIRIVLPFKGEVKERGVTNTETRVTFTPTKTRRFEKRVADEVRLAMRKMQTKPFEVPVAVRFAFMFNGPEGLMPVAAKLGDLSNLVKAIEDAMNGIAYIDDRLIQRADSVVKFAGPDDLIFIELTAARPGLPAWLDGFVGMLCQGNPPRGFPCVAEVASA
jgi:Holliday junction resolvase RusA-like endonuclease